MVLSEKVDTGENGYYQKSVRWKTGRENELFSFQQVALEGE